MDMMFEMGQNCNNYSNNVCLVVVVVVVVQEKNSACVFQFSERFDNHNCMLELDLVLGA